MREALIYEYSRILSYLIAMFLYQDSSIWFPPRPKSYLVSGSGPPEQCQACAQVHGVNHKSYQMVANSHNFCAIIIPVYHTAESHGRLQGL